MIMRHKWKWGICRKSKRKVKECILRDEEDQSMLIYMCEDSIMKPTKQYLKMEEMGI
jgi:hypothetical protein